MIDPRIKYIFDEVKNDLEGAIIAQVVSVVGMIIIECCEPPTTFVLAMCLLSVVGQLTLMSLKIKDYNEARKNSEESFAKEVLES